MRMFWYSRRTFVATLAILVLAGLCMIKGLDVAMSIAMIATGFAGANAYEGSAESKAAAAVADSAAKPATPEGE